MHVFNKYFLKLIQKNIWVKAVGLETITGVTQQDDKKDKQAQICLHKQ